MPSYRIDKVENLIKQELSLIFLQKIKDIDLGFLTLTKVKVSPDLKIASVYISIYEKEKRDIVIEKVKLKTKFIRSELASRINLRFVPELRFFLDDTLDYVEKIEELIKKSRKNDQQKNEF